MQGDVLLDVALESVIDSHKLNDNAVTVMLKEQDMSQKQKGKEAEMYDIMGIAEWSEEGKRNIAGSLEG